MGNLGRPRVYRALFFKDPISTSTILYKTISCSLLLVSYEIVKHACNAHVGIPVFAVNKSCRSSLDHFNLEWCFWSCQYMDSRLYHSRPGWTVVPYHCEVNLCLGASHACCMFRR